VTQSDPVHERMTGLQGHLISGLPWNKGIDGITARLPRSNRRTSKPMGYLLSVPWDLGAIPVQQPHHGMAGSISLMLCCLLFASGALYSSRMTSRT
jgi:hypothetical protein